MRRWITRFWRTLSAGGLILGTVFFAASLTPTLVPRTSFTQGVLSGACFAAGYGIGVAWRWLWRYMELPELRERWLIAFKMGATAVCAIAAIPFLWWNRDWQNAIRRLMELEPQGSAHPFEVCIIAVITFLAVIALARLFGAVVRLVSSRTGRFVPRRVSKVLGFAAAILLFWAVANGVFFRYAFRALDSSFAHLDALIEPDRPRPAAAVRSGSAASLIDWRDLGRAGREFVAGGPAADDIRRITRTEAMEPIRVYVGLGAAETVEERAHLALEELERVGAFERSVLVIITPTGTGWVDPAAMDTAEYLHHGDIASVALQYSYLSSPLALLLQPDYGLEAARTLFTAVYRHWTRLPPDARPKLYLHGLSLGAMHSERSAELIEILADPIQGALWSGPPFASRIWRAVTEHRNPGSPAWLPRFRDGSFVRFFNQNGTTVPAQTPWGPLRIVYLQYANDPVTFFDYRSFYRRPEWMDAPRGPGVSPALRWYPVVSMLQLALDMILAMDMPPGHGHAYASEHYTEAWIALTEPPGWSAEEIERLKRHLAARSRH